MSEGFANNMRHVIWYNLTGFGGSWCFPDDKHFCDYSLPWFFLRKSPCEGWGVANCVSTLPFFGVPGLDLGLLGRAVVFLGKREARKGGLGVLMGRQIG